MSIRGVLGLVGVSALLPLTGCSAPAGVAITDRTLAMVAAEHVGEPSYAVGEAYGMASEFTGELARTTLVYPMPDPPRGATGTEVQVLVGTGFLHEDLARCPTSHQDSCVDLDGGSTMVWSLFDPGEDPGHVQVTVVKGETTVQVALYGALLTEDPRTADLPVDVDALVAAAHDPRLDSTTNPEVVDAAEHLDFWRAGRVSE
ncbi:hypothetical protein [Nocardioides currus]|uniref:Uncharacterized protein n=1 Tax=Nocardioides currus TaxID=2133958 RepID=A0A2R7YY38_9ACTN|nr:hypothetical protein [Nocardioides currus]PUA81310.1 hypothetical protein C7S10_09825 [Nocardioides currus]